MKEKEKLNEYITYQVKCTCCKETYNIPVYEEDMEQFLNGDALVQDAFPYLAPWQREMFLSGICPTCWYNSFNELD